MADQIRMAPIQPEIVRVFVDHENLHRELGAEPPFPFGHDGFGGADQTGNGMAPRVQVGYELMASRSSAVVVDVEDPAVDARRRTRVTRHQVDFNVRAEHGAERGDDGLDQAARSAFDEQQAGGGRHPPPKEVAHDFLV
jgi:hypothetical protein